MIQTKTLEPTVKLPHIEGFIPSDRMDVCYLASDVDSALYEMLLAQENMRIRALNAEYRYYDLLKQVADEHCVSVQKETEQAKVNISFLQGTLEKLETGDAGLDDKA